MACFVGKRDESTSLRQAAALNTIACGESRQLSSGSASTRGSERRQGNGLQYPLDMRLETAGEKNLSDIIDAVRSLLLVS